MTEITTEMVERAYNRFMQTMSETEDCQRCVSRGYHHGFDEHGNDPDRCEVCGGSGFVPKFDEMSAMREALGAALSEYEG